MFKSSETFQFDNQQHKYMFRAYNMTYRNERAIELPIMIKYLKNYKGKRILEVGNVMSHYIKHNHDIVDKYEQAVNIRNEDIVDFKPAEKYDLIISISTLEHVGWDEEIKDPKKINRALENLKNCLNENGRLIVTVPLGYNSYLDDLIKNKELLLNNLCFFKRISTDNRWIEVDYEQVEGSEFNKPYPYANGLVIATN